MKILIDECLDWRLCRSLPQHACRSVQAMGWSGIRNGTLLKIAQEQFDVFITGDLNLQFQQSTHSFNLAIIVLAGGGTRLSDTEPLMSKVAEVLSDLAPGEIMRIPNDSPSRFLLDHE
jgi:hypothetical protein